LAIKKTINEPITQLIIIHIAPSQVPYKKPLMRDNKEAIGKLKMINKI
jgi:hypothetical protein